MSAHLVVLLAATPLLFPQGTSAQDFARALETRDADALQSWSRSYPADVPRRLRLWAEGQRRDVVEAVVLDHA